jgi:hypothetical protein
VTTLCLCDWVETRADRERRLATAGIAAPAATHQVVPGAIADAAAPAACTSALANEIRLKQEQAT